MVTKCSNSSWASNKPILRSATSYPQVFIWLKQLWKCNLWWSSSPSSTNDWNFFICSATLWKSLPWNSYFNMFHTFFMTNPEGNGQYQTWYIVLWHSSRQWHSILQVPLYTLEGDPPRKLFSWHDNISRDTDEFANFLSWNKELCLIL